MTPDALRQALADLGYTQTAFADYIGVHRLTVNHWLTGRHPVPRYVDVIIELLTERAEKMDTLDIRRISTILAALRYWQWRRDEITHSLNTRGGAILRIESNDDEVDPLSDGEIDALCEEVNGWGIVNDIEG